MRCIALILAISLIGCKASEHSTSEGPVWKDAYSAKECAALLERKTFLQRCGDGSLASAMKVINNDISKCMPFSKPQQMSGLWVRDLEYSGFYSGAEKLSDIAGKDSNTWLSLDLREREITAGQGTGNLVYRVEFIGRHSLCEFGYGHMGGYPQEVIVDRFLKKVPLSDAR